MIAAAVDYIKANNLPPMCLWVCDKAGVTVASMRMDGTAARYVHAAHRKAYSSAVFERDTAGIIDFWEGQAKSGHQREADWNDPMVTTLPGGYCVCNGRRGGNLQMWDVIGGFGSAGDDVRSTKTVSPRPRSPRWARATDTGGTGVRRVDDFSLRQPGPRPDTGRHAGR